MPEENWHKENWDVSHRITRVEGRMDATEKNIDRLELNQDRIFGKLDKLSGKVALICGAGIILQILASWLLSKGHP